MPIKNKLAQITDFRIDHLPCCPAACRDNHGILSTLAEDYTRSHKESEILHDELQRLVSYKSIAISIHGQNKRNELLYRIDDHEHDDTTSQTGPPAYILQEGT